MLAPRWRLTDEIALEAAYTLVAQRRTVYTAGEGADAPAPPLEWFTGGSAHAAGAVVRYSTLKAYTRAPELPAYEVALGISTALAGAGYAPRATTIRVTGRVYVDRRRLGALLPGRGAAEPVSLPPAAAPADTLARSPVAPPEPPVAADTAAPPPDRR